MDSCPVRSLSVSWHHCAGVPREKIFINRYQDGLLFTFLLYWFVLLTYINMFYLCVWYNWLYWCRILFYSTLLCSVLFYSSLLVYFGQYNSQNHVPQGDKIQDNSWQGMEFAAENCQVKGCTCSLASCFTCVLVLFRRMGWYYYWINDLGYLSSGFTI